MRPDHAGPRQAQRRRPQDLAPADHEHDVRVERAQCCEPVRLVDASHASERDAVASAHGRVVDGAAALGRELGVERDGAGDRGAGREQGLERREPFRMAAHPPEAHHILSADGCARRRAPPR